MRYLLLPPLIFLIIACGGGGETSDSSISAPDNSQQPLPTDLFSEYNGLSTRASINSQNSHAVVYHTTLVTDIVNVLVFGDELKKLRFDALVSNYTDNIFGDCESGSLEAVAISDNTVDVTYSNCSTGPYIIDGNGKLSVDSFDQFGDVSTGTLEFENLSVISGLHGTEHNVKGKVDLDFSNNVQSSLNVLIKEKNTNASYYLEEFKSDLLAYESKAIYSVEGRLYISTLGYLDLTTIISPDVSSKSEDDSLAIMVSGDADLLISVISESTVRLSLEQSESQYAVAAEIPYSFFIQKEFESISNKPPTAVVEELSDLIDKNTNIVLDASASFDPDYDLVSFKWIVEEFPDGAHFQLSASNRDIAALVAKTAGNYQLSVLISDGQTETDKHTISFYVRKDPANVSIVGNIDSIVIGTPIEFDVIVDNPADDGPFEITLNHGPASMLYESEKGLEWDGHIPDFGTDTLVNFGVRVTNTDHVVLDRHQILVSTPETKPAIFLPGYSGGRQSWQDINSDNVDDLLRFNNGTIEAWDFSGLVPQNLFTYMGNVAGWEFATYDKTEKVLIAKSDNGEFYRYDPLSDRASLLFKGDTNSRREWTAILIDIDGDGERELVSNAYVRNLTSGERLHSFNIAFGSSFTPIMMSDVDGDGISELVIGSNVFEKNTFELITNIEGVNLGYYDKAYWYDIDGDKKDELLLAQVSSGVNIYDYEDGQLQLKQSVYEHQDPTTTMSFSSLPDFSEIYIASNSGTLITSYKKDEQGNYLANAEMKINDSNLHTPSTTNSQPSSCRLSNSFRNTRNTTILHECSKAYAVRGSDDEISRKYISIIPFGSDISVLPYDFSTQLSLGGFSDIQRADDDIFTIGTTAGVVSIDNELNVSIEAGLLGANLRGSYVNYHHSALIDNVLLGWDIETEHHPTNSSILYGFDIQGNETHSSISRPRLSEIVGVFENTGKQILITSEYKKFIFWSLPDLDVIAEIEYETDDNYSWGFNDISYWRSFTFNGSRYLAFLLENRIVLVKEENDTFISEGSYELPANFNGEDNSIFEPISLEGKPYLILMQSNSSPNQLDKAMFSLTEKIFSLESTSLTTDPVAGFSKLQMCMNTLENGSTVAYIHSSEFDVDIEDIGNNARQYKVIAVDIQSNEIVWSSRKLPGRYSVGYDMECSNGKVGQQIMLSTTYYLYLAD